MLVCAWSRVTNVRAFAHLFSCIRVPVLIYIHTHNNNTTQACPWMPRRTADWLAKTYIGHAAAQDSVPGLRDADYSDWEWVHRSDGVRYLQSGQWLQAFSDEWTPAQVWLDGIVFVRGPRISFCAFRNL